MFREEKALKREELTFKCEILLSKYFRVEFHSNGNFHLKFIQRVSLVFKSLSHNKKNYSFIYKIRVVI